MRVRVYRWQNRIVTEKEGTLGGPLSLSCVKLLNREDAAVNSMDATHHIPTDVRAAIRAFLNACQEKGTRLATVEALDAVHRVFPDLDISDADLIDAITSEASVAGFDVEVDAGNASNSQKRTSLERWDNEGGAIGRHLRTEAQRMIDHDKSGARRRTKETKDRNDAI